MDAFSTQRVKLYTSEYKKVITIDTHHESDNLFIYDDIENSLEQEWIIYPVDNSKYIIAHPVTGKVISRIENSKNICIQDYKVNEMKQQWSLEDTNLSNTYKLVNEDNGEVITASNNNNQVLSSTDTDTPDQQWSFKAIRNIEIPEKPILSNEKQVELDAPQYKQATDNLPETTTPRLTGWTVVPAILIADNEFPQKTKLRLSPYYILEKYEYWTRVENFSLIPGERVDTTYYHGITKTSQNSLEQHLGMTIDEKGGFKFSLENKVDNAGGVFGITYDIHRNLQKDLTIKESTSTTEMSSIEQTDTHDNQNHETIYYYAYYIWTTELILKRPAQNQIDPTIPISKWSFTNNERVHATDYTDDR
ncbi:RICIN domain-containing protein [Bacillus cereus]